jgi:Protein of unknown function (DUF1360).
MNEHTQFLSGLVDEILFITLILGLATHRVTGIIVEDEILRGLRETIWRHLPPETSLIGYFFTCTRCVSFWVGLAFFIAFVLLPLPTVVVAVLLSISAIVVIINDFRDR